MAWNYRVFIDQSGDEGEGNWYHIREAYYEAGQPTDGEPRSWGGAPSLVGGEDIEELAQMLLKMRAALDKPVLDSGTGKVVKE